MSATHWRTEHTTGPIYAPHPNPLPGGEREKTRPRRTEHTTGPTYAPHPNPLPGGEREKTRPRRTEHTTVPIYAPHPPPRQREGKISIPANGTCHRAHLCPSPQPSPRRGEGENQTPANGTYHRAHLCPLPPRRREGKPPHQREEITFSAARRRSPQARRLFPSQSECFYKPECRSGYRGCPAAPARSLPGSKHQQSREPYQ